MKTSMTITGKAQYSYDFPNDILIISMEDQTYDSSIEYGNYVIDLNKEDHVIGLRVFDASVAIGVPKYHLKEENMRKLVFEAFIEDSEVTVRVKIRSIVRNNEISRPVVNFVQDASSYGLPDSRVKATI